MPEDEVRGFELICTDQIFQDMSVIGGRYIHVITDNRGRTVTTNEQRLDDIPDRLVKAHNDAIASTRCDDGTLCEKEQLYRSTIRFKVSKPFARYIHSSMLVHGFIEDIIDAYPDSELYVWTCEGPDVETCCKCVFDKLENMSNNSHTALILLGLISAALDTLRPEQGARFKMEDGMGIMNIYVALAEME